MTCEEVWIAAILIRSSCRAIRCGSIVPLCIEVSISACRKSFYTCSPKIALARSTATISFPFAPTASSKGTYRLVNPFAPKLIRIHDSSLDDWRQVILGLDAIRNSVRKVPCREPTVPTICLCQFDPFSFPISPSEWGRKGQHTASGMLEKAL